MVARIPVKDKVVGSNPTVGALTLKRELIQPTRHCRLDSIFVIFIVIEHEMA
jgi:hypothetical protein